MSPVKLEAKQELRRSLPSVDEVLRSPQIAEKILRAGENRMADIVRSALSEVRNEIADGQEQRTVRDELLNLIASKAINALERESMTGVRRVINATGVIIHTNLGRAPLSVDARLAIAESSGYCSLEYGIESGRRGSRGSLVEEMLVRITGAEDAIVVNNCAAAAFFVLTAFASGREVIISRGELVEIGGDFRVPDVLEQSGAIMREIGTTNRTKISDYQKAINEKTGVLLKVHPSNYRVVGFTSTPTLRELSKLAGDNHLILFEDLGSGALIDLAPYGVIDEPLVSASIAAGVDLVSFSGDKLLGGPQAGIIAGKKHLVEKLRKHPLYRALRSDKLTLSALEATLKSYERNTAHTDIPVISSIAATEEQLHGRAQMLVESLVSCSNIRAKIVTGESAVGGGTAPTSRPRTPLIAIEHSSKSVELIEVRLRKSDPPVIARIAGGALLLDLRTVSESEQRELEGILALLD